MEINNRLDIENRNLLREIQGKKVTEDELSAIKAEFVGVCSDLD
jgi:hypothetical protein